MTTDGDLSITCPKHSGSVGDGHEARVGRLEIDEGKIPVGPAALRFTPKCLIEGESEFRLESMMMPQLRSLPAAGFGRQKPLRAQDDDRYLIYFGEGEEGAIKDNDAWRMASLRAGTSFERTARQTAS